MAERIKLPHMKIVWRNLAGRPTDWDKKGGKRNFAIVLEDMADVQVLQNLGMNVKMFNKKDPNAPDSYYIKVKVNFRNDDNGNVTSPLIYLVNGDSKSKPLTPNNVAVVDGAIIDYCDIYIKPYYATVNGQNFVSAYLDTMYVNVIKDEFEEKYSMYKEDIEEDDGDCEEIPFE